MQDVIFCLIYFSILKNEMENIMVILDISREKED